MLKNHVAISNDGSLVKFRLHTAAARAWWRDNVRNVNQEAASLLPLLTIVKGDVPFAYVENRFAQDIYEGMLEHFGK